MIELIIGSGIIGVLIGTFIGHYFAKRRQQDSWKKEESEKIDIMLSSLDLEIENNLKIAKENQKNASQGRSVAERHNLSIFPLTAYDKFSISITTKLKDQLGEKAITYLMKGYKQCRKFNQAFKDYKEGRRPSSRSDLQNFRQIISNFEEYQELRKSK